MRHITAFYERWHWVILLLVAPFLLFPSPRWTLMLLVLPLVWLLVRLMGGQPIPPTPFNGAIYVLSFMLCVSLFVTYDFAVSQPKIAGLLLGIGTFYTVARAGQHPCGWWLCILAFFGLGVGMAGVALVGTQWENKLGIFNALFLQTLQSLKMPMGNTEGFNPNEVAGALLWVAPLCAAVCMILLWRPQDLLFIIGRQYRFILTWTMVSALVFVLLVFILTQSRGAYIGLAVAMMLTFILGRTHFGRWWRIVGLWLIVTLGLVVTLFIYQRGLQPASAPAAAESTRSLDTLAERMEIWERAIYAIHDFPFTGTGMNTFRHVVHLLYPLFLVPPDMDIGHAHNEFLQAALDLGLPGLVAFLALYLIAFALLRRLWLCTPTFDNPPIHAAFSIQCRQLLFKNLPYLTLGLAGSLLAHLIYSMTDAIALGAKPGILFWMLLGLIASLFIQTQTSQSLENLNLQTNSPVEDLSGFEYPNDLTVATSFPATRDEER